MNNKMSRRQFLKKYMVPVPFLGVVYAFRINDKWSGKLKPEKNREVSAFEPAYLKLFKEGKLKERAELLYDSLECCKLCPRECSVNRLEGQKGHCNASSELVVSSFNPHFGEEKPLVGRSGSGTIFFAHCSMHCVFCINWEISQSGIGSVVSTEELSGMMLKLQLMGCNNINVVTPTHYLPHILLALDVAAGKGLRLPVVYNTCGWEKLEMLRLLDGVVDIYLPDFKYADSEMSTRYSSADTYPEFAKKAIKEMNRQVGVALPDSDGIIRHGLMIRHLVMPNNIGGTGKVVDWIAENLPLNTYVNLMSQYTPMYKANEYPLINRRLTRKEYADAVSRAKSAGLTNLEIQGMGI